VLREAAEYPNSFTPLDSSQERIETPRYTLCLGIGATVQRQRFAADELDAVLAEVRGLLRARDRFETEWEIGSQAQPDGLAELLLGRGLVREGRATAVVLSAAPPPPPAEIEARAVASVDEQLAAAEVQFAAFGTPPEEIAQRRAEIARDWPPVGRITHAAWRNGELIAAGSCAPTPHGLALFGGATRPDRRGLGGYRALIAARWRHAVELGSPALLTQAGPMSFPILSRLGFVAVGSVDQLRDRFS
jgi:hypothetical protein